MANTQVNTNSMTRGQVAIVISICAVAACGVLVLAVVILRAALSVDRPADIDSSATEQQKPEPGPQPPERGVSDTPEEPENQVSDDSETSPLPGETAQQTPSDQPTSRTTQNPQGSSLPTQTDTPPASTGQTPGKPPGPTGSGPSPGNPPDGYVIDDSAQYSGQTKSTADVLRNLRLTEEAEAMLSGYTIGLARKDELRNQCAGPRGFMVRINTGGCWTSHKRIFALDFDVKDSDLGAFESEEEMVIAHELLHAFYFAITPAERDAVNAELKKLCRDDECSNILKGRYGSVDEATRLNEIHSLAGSERVGGLPPALEEHYARFFESRQAVLGYYDASLVGTIFRLSEDVKLKKQEIDERRQEHKELGDRLSKLDRGSAEYERVKKERDDLSSTINELWKEYNPVWDELLELRRNQRRL